MCRRCQKSLPTMEKSQASQDKKGINESRVKENASLVIKNEEDVEKSSLVQKNGQEMIGKLKKEIQELEDRNCRLEEILQITTEYNNLLEMNLSFAERLIMLMQKDPQILQSTHSRDQQRSVPPIIKLRGLGEVEKSYLRNYVQSLIKRIEGQNDMKSTPSKI